MKTVYIPTKELSRMGKSALGWFLISKGFPFKNTGTTMNPKYVPVGVWRVSNHPVEGVIEFTHFEEGEDLE